MAVVPHGGGSMIVLDRADLANIIAQAGMEGFGAGPHEHDDEDGGYWTGPQVALATFALMSGAMAANRAMVALYIKLAAYERSRDHEQICKLIFMIFFNDGIRIIYVNFKF